jgi:hypothetical protein
MDAATMPSMFRVARGVTMLAAWGVRHQRTASATAMFAMRVYAMPGLCVTPNAMPATAFRIDQQQLCGHFL